MPTPYPIELLIAVGIAFGAAIALLLVLWRRVSARVDLERAERIIEEEFDALDR